jgi:hypothetical protein
MMRLAFECGLDDGIMIILPTLRKVNALIFRTSHDAPHVWDVSCTPELEVF